MNFIKQIFENKVDESVHKYFVRYGPGEFDDRAATMIKNSKTFKIQTSFEYCNYFVKLLAENLDEKLKVKGKIFSTTEIPDSVKKKKLFLVEIDSEYTPEELSKLVSERDEDSTLLLNIEGYLKIKQSLQKPGKSLDPKFCTLSFKEHEELREKILDEFVFDAEHDFKQLNISHKFIIEKLVVPEEYKNDFAKARVMAKRKGLIDRKLNIDDREIKNQTDFLV